MLRALGEQLKILAADPKNNFASKIRQLSGPREAARYGQPLRRMILAMPHMITQLRLWNGEASLPARAKRMQEFALSYLYDPIDFLSARSSGLFRYLDDAYLIAKIYQTTLDDFKASGTKNPSQNSALSKNIPTWIDLAKRLLPKETAQIDKLLDEASRKRISRNRPMQSKRKRKNRGG